MINIVFEGAPGAGKTTIINEVVKKLKIIKRLSEYDMYTTLI